MVGEKYCVTHTRLNGMPIFVYFSVKYVIRLLSGTN